MALPRPSRKGAEKNSADGVTLGAIPHRLQYSRASCAARHLLGEYHAETDIARGRRDARRGPGTRRLAPAQAQIKIGTAGPITGSNASFGAQLKEGAEQAVADINAHGGVLGKQLALTVGDDACDPKQAVSVANSFASSGIVFVDGHFCSSSSIPASKVYARGGHPRDHARLDQPGLHRQGGLEHVPHLRARRPAGQGGRRLHGQARSRNDKIAILNDNSAYGKGLADETKKNLNARRQAGGDVCRLRAGREGLFGAGVAHEVRGHQR